MRLPLWSLVVLCGCAAPSSDRGTEPAAAPADRQILVQVYVLDDEADEPSRPVPGATSSGKPDSPADQEYLLWPNRTTVLPLGDPFKPLQLKIAPRAGGGWRTTFRQQGEPEQTRDLGPHQALVLRATEGGRRRLLVPRPVY